jgi:ABC-type branched-subunit amino acid transport system ATPase component
MSGPRVLLLDEPSLGLAPRITDELYEHLDTLRAGGLTLIIVEESATRATTLADDALILRNGKVVISGTAREVAADPRLKQAYLGTA